jgi:hypothetical protein
MLADHPLSSPHPLRNSTLPRVPIGRKADYVVTRSLIPPDDAAGPPLLSNRTFRLYRMKAGVPGPDRSSRRTIEDLGGTIE